MNSLVFLLFELGRAQAQLAEFFWAAGSESLVERCRPVLSDAEYRTTFVGVVADCQYAIERLALKFIQNHISGSEAQLAQNVLIRRFKELKAFA